MYFVTKEFSICASHHLRNYVGACERLHGHNYKIQVTLCAEDLDKKGMVYDFKEIKRACKELIDDKYDHQNLNEVEPFMDINPTAENMASTFYYDLEKFLSNNSVPGTKVQVYSVKIWETDDSFAEFR